MNLRLIFTTVLLFVFSMPLFSQNSATPSDGNTQSEDDNRIGYQAFELESTNLQEADLGMEVYIRDIFPIISDRDVDEILNSREYRSQPVPVVKNDGSIDTVLNYVVRYNVRENFIADDATLLWELNIPEFKSHLFHIYKNDTLYLDSWNNVVGKPGSKTYAGHFEAYRIRNWPSWKDPSKDKAHLPPTPPGPNNPLGLFVVHYDENSLRYFHGNNKNHLIFEEDRDLSLGCVRNDNGNIEKMKQFIIKNVVKSQDLSGWLNSRRSLVYDFKEEDKFPVLIYYKTFDINKDNKGFYIEFFRDIYNYANPANINRTLNDPELITLTTRENVLAEFKQKYNQGITEEQFDKILSNLLNKHVFYKKYYFDELYKKLSLGN